MDAFSGSINQEMFEYIMYSRLAFADISGFNPNVFYEIGARHSAQESGTVLFRQLGHAIPFDITTIKVFEYDFQTDETAIKSREFITNVISETLRRNRLDSPVRLALRSQWGGNPSPAPKPNPTSASAPASQALPSAEPLPPPPAADHWRKQEIEGFMRDAEEAIRLNDLNMARANYWGALRFDPLNIIARMRLGLTLKRQGKHYEALEEFVTVTKLAPNYGEAWKEKGVVEGLIARKIPANERQKTQWLPDGYDSLNRATLPIPNDFDAWSSLAGVLKNIRGDYAAAREMYAHAANISDGHPYPLLNALKLEALHAGRLEVESVREKLINAEKLRLAQTLTTPPTDTPWCYFDLAEIALYQGDKEKFLSYSIYTLRYLRDPQLQRDVHRSENRVESYHQLRSTIAQVNGKKELGGRTDLDVAISNHCGRLVANVVIAYNSMLLSGLLSRSLATGNEKAQDLLRRISPVAWRHLHFIGHYAFRDKRQPIDLEAILAGIDWE